MVPWLIALDDADCPTKGSVNTVLHPRDEGWKPLSAASAVQSVQALISASSMDPKDFKLHTVYSGSFEQKKTFITRWSGSRVQICLCRASGNHSRKLFQKTIEGFGCKINGRVLRAALRHSLVRFSSPTVSCKGVFKSAAIAVGCDWLACT